MSFTPTAEQNAILEAFTAGKHLVVQAGAGTGKTSTLKMLAKSTERRGTYLAFNKAIADEARRAFPHTVRAMTAHSLAWQEYGNRFAARMRADRQGWGPTIGFLNAEPMSFRLPDKSRRTLTAYQVARHAVDTVKRFCQSNDRELTTRHVPIIPGLDYGFAARSLAGENHALLCDRILPMARRVWADVQRTEGVITYDHSYYLKGWALTEPTIAGDYILFDESQDASPVIAGVVNRQTHLQRILVGDTAQQIYCQPVGTLVDVPDLRAPAPAKRACSFGLCDRQRDHKSSGLCDLHERQRRAGNELTVIPRGPSKSDAVRKVPIESLQTGDHVVTYDNAHVFLRGRPVTSTRRFHYSGDLVRITTPTGLSSAYTPRHHCVVRFGSEGSETHVVYLMRKGDSFRVGRVPLIYKYAKGYAFGPGLRAGAEGADALWILSVHETVADAALAEALTQHAYNIPGVRFRSSTAHRDVLDVEAFWNKHGANPDAGLRCLEGHGLIPDCPLWTAGRRNLVGLRRPFVTAAANLIDGMAVLPSGARKQWSGKRDWSAPRDMWDPIAVSREHYDGDIVSLEVADHHTYFGDGILTHNSFAGAVDAMEEFAAKKDVEVLSLTESFRFGPTIAAAANVFLAELSAPLRLTGTPKVDSTIGTLDLPGLGSVAADAVLCRTNAGALDEVITLQQAKRRVCLLGGAADLRRFVEAARELQTTGKTNFASLMAFESWAQVEDHVATAPGGDELETMVELVNSYGVEVLLGALNACVHESAADVIVSTAHKAKGREWDAVRISADFELDPEATPEVRSAEMMLAYVAITRAKRLLDPGLLAQPLKMGRIPVAATTLTESSADTPPAEAAATAEQEATTTPADADTDEPPFGVPVDADTTVGRFVPITAETYDRLAAAAATWGGTPDEFAARLLAGALAALVPPTR